RALVGVTLSYVFIAVAVVGVIAWATLGSATGKGPKESAAPSDPVPVTSTTTTPAPPSTVAAADLAGLLPDLVELKSLTGQQRLSAGQIYTVMSADGTTTDPPDCASLSGAAIPETYDQNVVTGSYGQVFNGPSDPMQPVFVNPNVVAFPDAAAAQAQVRLLKAAWQRCAESTITVNYPTVGRLVESVGKPVDAGNGITALEVELPKGAGICVRTIAAKGNVVVDDYLTTLSADVPHAVALTNAILAKIPG
ncbi:sensor domain-containing protein, partial [Mycobacterium sp. M1]